MAQGSHAACQPPCQAMFAAGVNTHLQADTSGRGIALRCVQDSFDLLGPCVSWELDSRKGWLPFEAPFSKPQRASLGIKHVTSCLAPSKWLPLLGVGQGCNSSPVSALVFPPLGGTLFSMELGAQEETRLPNLPVSFHDWREGKSCWPALRRSTL